MSVRRTIDSQAGNRRTAGRRWVLRLKGTALLLLVTGVFLFVPAMQGIGLTADTSSPEPGDPAVDVDLAARAAVADLVARR
jgi:hypothetical protein